MSGKLVLVTGVTGFIAGHVVSELLQAGYRVRATARGSKFNHLKNTMNIPGLEFIQIDDVDSSDMSEALHGVDAVLHLASSLLGRTNAEDALKSYLIKSAEDGTLHILRATLKAGIGKIVITGTLGSVLNPSLSHDSTGKTFSGSDWGSVTKEEMKNNQSNAFSLYLASKIFAEKAIWAFANEHPELDVTTILPGFVYGPFAKLFPFPSPTNLSTNRYIYSLMTGEIPHMLPPVFVDVRDVAKAHILALDIPRAGLQEKRYLLVAGLLTWRDAAAHLREMHPDLATLKPEEFEDPPGPLFGYDTSKTEEKLGIKFIDPKDTLIAAVDSLLDAQKTWVE